MKAISLWQPWASTMGFGLKKNETRHWSTLYRGPLLIHAAKRKVRVPWDIWDIVENNGLNLRHLPYGALICKVDLIDCQQIGDDNCPLQDSLEYKLGNYEHGRFMWITDNLKTVEPISFKGRQGFFDVPDELVKGLF
jgi:activating signal cointegrator 1